MIRELFGCLKHLILLINYNCINKLKTKSCFNATSNELPRKSISIFIGFTNSLGCVNMARTNPSEMKRCMGIGYWQHERNPRRRRTSAKSKLVDQFQLDECGSGWRPAECNIWKFVCEAFDHLKSNHVTMLKQ